MTKNQTTVSAMLEVCALFTVDTGQNVPSGRNAPRPRLYTLSVTPSHSRPMVVENIHFSASEKTDHPLFGNGTCFGLDISYRDSTCSSSEVKLYWDPETQRYLQSAPHTGWLHIQ